MVEEPLADLPLETISRSQLRRERSKEKMEKMLRLEALDENRAAKKSAKNTPQPLEEQDQNVYSKEEGRKSQAATARAKIHPESMMLEQAEDQFQAEETEEPIKETKTKRQKQPQQKTQKNRNKENEPPKTSTTRRAKSAASKSKANKKIIRQKQAKQPAESADQEHSSHSQSSGSDEGQSEEPTESLEEVPAAQDHRSPKSSNFAKQPMEEEPIEPASSLQESPKKKQRGPQPTKQTIEDEEELINSIVLSNLSPRKSDRQVSDGKRDSPKKYSPQKNKDKLDSPSKSRSPQKKRKSPTKEVEPEDLNGEEEQDSLDMHYFDGIPLEDLIRDGQLVIGEADENELFELLVMGDGEEEMEFEYEIPSEAAHYLRMPHHQRPDYFKRLNECYFEELEQGKETPNDKEEASKKVTFDKKKKVKSTPG